MKIHKKFIIFYGYVVSSCGTNNMILIKLTEKDYEKDITDRYIVLVVIKFLKYLKSCYRNCFSKS